MDRFIVSDVMPSLPLILYLKSSMDRFIVDSIADEINEQIFKIQYG